MNFKKIMLFGLSSFFICSSFLLAPRKSNSTAKSCARCTTCGRKPKKTEPTHDSELRDVKHSRQTQAPRSNPRSTTRRETSRRASQTRTRGTE